MKKAIEKRQKPMKDIITSTDTTYRIKAGAPDEHVATLHAHHGEVVVLLRRELVQGPLVLPVHLVEDDDVDVLGQGVDLVGALLQDVLDPAILLEGGMPTFHWPICRS